MVKVRVENSDGTYSGGLFQPNAASASRLWRGVDRGGHQEYLFALEGDLEDWEGCHFPLLLYRESLQPVYKGTAESNSLFDERSYGVWLSPSEGLAWFKHVGYEPPADLVGAAYAMGSSETESTVSFMPSRWFLSEVGIPSERLRSAARTGKLARRKLNGEWRYSVSGVRKLWPEDYESL